MARKRTFKNIRRRVLQCVLVLLPVTILIYLLRQNSSDKFTAVWGLAFSDDFAKSGQNLKTPSKQSGSCHVKTDCPEDHFSFFVQSGAANVMPPKICFQNKLVLGAVMNNAGIGINIAILNGKTGEVTKTSHFNMYSGEVEPLIKFVKTIEKGSVVLIATYDEPATKLNDEARKLIAELGSTEIRSLGYRDNWVFVGGKGAEVKSSFEKYLKNDKTRNKYEEWPELIELGGCIPKYLEGPSGSS